MKLLYETQSPFGKIRVYEDDDGKRYLRLGKGTEIHSMYDPDHVLVPVFEESYWGIRPKARRQKVEQLLRRGNMLDRRPS